MDADAATAGARPSTVGKGIQKQEIDRQRLEVALRSGVELCGSTGCLAKLAPTVVSRSVGELRTALQCVQREIDNITVAIAHGRKAVSSR